MTLRSERVIGVHLYKLRHTVTSIRRALRPSPGATVPCGPREWCHPVARTVTHPPEDRRPARVLRLPLAPS